MILAHAALEVHEFKGRAGINVLKS